MPYINERGEIVESRPFWSISTFTDMFQGFFRMVSLFFQTLFMMSPESNSRNARGSRSGPSPGRRPPPGPGPGRRRVGGFGSGTGPDMGGVMPCMPGGG